jgi:hypothetical protein
MRSRLSRLRPKPGVVLGAIAVFFAIGGIGYAAATVGTNDIKNGAVTKKKLHKNAVISKKVKNHSLKRVDLAFNAVGPTGPQGPAGPAGAGTNYNARLNAGGSVSRTVGAFTLTTSASGAANCAATTISSSGDAHYTTVIDNSDPFAGTALNNGNNHTSQVAAAAFALENLKAVTDNGGSQLLGHAVGCSNVGGFAVTYGSLLGA